MIPDRSCRFLARALAPLVLALAAGALPAQAQPASPSIAGPWHGAIEVATTKLTIRVVFVEDASGVKATIDIPQQGAKGLPLTAVSRDGAAVHFEIPAGQTTAVFQGTLAGDRISGSFTQGPVTGTFYLDRGEAPPPPKPPDLPYKAENVTFTNGNVTLAGTLTIPNGEGPFPAILMITGSGPQNRDEELFGFKIFGVIADHLTRHGVAVLRYDDRGVGESSGGNTDPTTEDFAGDALVGLALLAARPEVDRTRVGLFGHSEGAIVAAIAAARSADVKFIVMMAGTATPGEQVLRRQTEDMARANGADGEHIAAILAAHAAMLEAIRTGKDVAEIEQAVKALANAQIDAMPEALRSKIPDRAAYVDGVVKTQARGIRSRWMKFFIDFDPASALVKVHCPVLALFGGKDLQVLEAVNRAPLEAALAKGGNTHVTVKSYPDANHLFITAVTGSPTEYSSLPKTFVPGFLDDVTSWILARTAGPAGAKGTGTLLQFLQ